MTRRHVLPALLLVFSLLLSGCAGPASLPTGPLAPEVSPLSAPGDYHGPEDPSLKSCRAFAIELFQCVVEDSPQGDVLLSPLSVFLSLSAVGNGARGETGREFSALLGRPEDLNPALAAYLRDLTAPEGSTELSQANSVWMDCHSPRPDDAFLETLSACYGAEFFSADMGARETVKQMNLWFSQKTDGLITEVVKELPMDNRVSLLNALCLKARWKDPFPPDRTYEESFAGADGKERSLPFLHCEYDCSTLFSDEAFEGVLLPYEDGGLGFFALLPREGTAAQLAQKLDGETFRALLSRLETHHLALALPKFQTDFGLDLCAPLADLGLQSAFGGETADFSGISPGLFLSEVLHRTTLEVGEEGTVAAAATQVNLPMSMLPTGTVVLDFDRPFLYSVVDLETGVPLFLGVFQGT